MLIKTSRAQARPAGIWNYLENPASGAFDSKRYDFPPDYAFDAASSAGLAFLASELELPNVRLVEPLAAVTHARDMIIKTGGGFPEFLSAFAANYGTTGGNQYGLQGTQTTNIPTVQADVQKGTWPTNIWGATMIIKYLDMQRLINAKRFGIAPPFTIQQLLDKGVKLIWGKAMDMVTYLGWNGQPGLINSNNVVAASLAAVGASGFRTWATKTSTEILNDINTTLLLTQEGSGYDTAGLADTILVDYDHWSILNAPMTIGGFNSILEYILSNNVARRQGIELEILPLPNPWISTQGTGSTSRMVAYKKDEETLYLQVPQPIQKVMTVPTVDQGGAYESLFNGCIGVVQILRPTAMHYTDGI
jgi:hypothetical protein